MAKMTQKQLDAKRAATPNGWEYDLFYFLTHGEHTATRKIELNDKEYIKATLLYRNEYERITNEYGISYNRETGRKLPTVNISKWTYNDTKTAASSWGLGVWETIGTPQKTQNYKYLMTCAVSDDFIMAKAGGNSARLNDGFIL